MIENCLNADKFHATLSQIFCASVCVYTGRHLSSSIQEHLPMRSEINVTVAWFH